MITPESGREPSEMVRVVVWLHRRPDGGLRVHSDTHPGLNLSGRDQDEVAADIGLAIKMLLEADGQWPIVAHCKRCGRLLDVPGDVASENCGGDCCACMADAGDPDCIAALGAGQAEGER